MENQMALAVFTTFSTLFATFLQLKYEGDGDLFQQHPILAPVEVCALVICWFLLGVGHKCPVFYQEFPRALPISVDFFACLSMACATSFLFSDSVRPLVFFICLLLPLLEILYWVFKKLDARFGETQFWVSWVDPVLCKLRRKMNRAFPLLEAQSSILPL